LTTTAVVLFGAMAPAVDAVATGTTGELLAAVVRPLELALLTTTPLVVPGVVWSIPTLPMIADPAGIGPEMF
jgi:hypothetical protein